MEKYQPNTRKPVNKISMREYQELAQRTSPDDGHDRMDNGMLGLIGETGEIVDEYKKYIYQSLADTPLPKGTIMEELGDVLWYLAELSQGLGKNMRDIMRGDFADYDARAIAKSKSAQKHNIRRIILSMSAQATAICDATEREEFKHVEFLMRKIMSGAANLAFACGSTIQDAACANIKKLRQRYPRGFDAAISMARYK